MFPHGEVSQRPREIIAFTALHGLPAWLGALLMGAVFAKIMSTANNFLFSGGRILLMMSSFAISRQTASTSGFSWYRD